MSEKIQQLEKEITGLKRFIIEDTVSQLDYDILKVTLFLVLAGIVIYGVITKIL